MLASPPLRATRRRALVAAAAAGSVVLGGSSCDVVEDPRQPSASGSPDASGSASPGAEPTEDADADLVAAIADDIARTLAVVTAAGRGRPAVARRLREVARTHRAHLAELPSGTPRASRVRVTGDDRAAVRRARTAEQSLQRRLAAAAVDADSGGLAALLASMSAAVAQQLASGALA